jgi:hypothetical protein
VIANAFVDALRVQLGDDDRSTLSLKQLCAACAEVTSLDTAVVLVTKGHPQAAMAASNGARQTEGLQFTLGEGPGIDVLSEGRPVLICDLGRTTSRWNQFAPAALALGVGAVFAYPLQVGAVRTGVLSFYADRAGKPSRGRLDDLATVASLVTDAVLAIQSGSPGRELAGSLANAAEHLAVVHQASGMVAVQLGSTVQDALVRLRARAFSDGVGVDDVARLVVARRLRFEQ